MNDETKRKIGLPLTEERKNPRCRNCGTEYRRAGSGAARGYCARCYQYARRHGGQPQSPEATGAAKKPTRANIVVDADDLKEFQLVHGRRSLSRFVRAAMAAAAK